jgi:hypothetical protein
MYIVQQLSEIFCRHQLEPYGPWFDVILGFLYLFSCLNNLSVGDKVVLSSPTITVLEFIYGFRSFRVCLMKLSALTLGVYRLIIVISFLVYFYFY